MAEAAVVGVAKHRKILDADKFIPVNFDVAVAQALPSVLVLAPGVVHRVPDQQIVEQTVAIATKLKEVGPVGVGA